MRARFFEFEDQSWFPATIRSGMTDYLRYIFQSACLYDPVSVILKVGLHRTGTNTIIDLCSGAGGPIAQVRKSLEKRYRLKPSFILSDKYPNLKAYTLLSHLSSGGISFCRESVDAMEVPANMKGLRTMFSGIHHFREKEVQAILQDAVDAGEGIAIFDGGSKNPLFLLGATLLHPLIIFLCTPFFTPFSWKRLIYTYLIPLIPLCTMWDGFISILRLYSPSELLAIANLTNHAGYQWHAGKIKNRFGIKITYLMGSPG